MKGLIIFMIVAVLAAYGYSKFRELEPRGEASRIATHAADAGPVVPVQASRYTCDGRTHCSHMTSCAEATYFIQHCPNTKMDGDHDGVPCEQQWCN